MGLPRLTRAPCAGSLCVLLALAGCGEPADVGAAFGALRPDTPDGGAPPPRFDGAEPVLRFDSPGGAFRVHYASVGAHAVPGEDRDASGVPDYVELVAREYDAVLAFFRDTLGFMPPESDLTRADDDGGDGRFDVYLLDFPNSADGAFRSEGCSDGPPRRCTGYMVQENDFDGRGYPSLQVATRVLASHELFHAVQSAYAADVSVVLSEGTAVWASEAYDPSLTDFEGFIDGYLARPERSLAQEPTGPVDAFSYGAALFFRYLEQKVAPPLVRELWAELGARAEPEPDWTAALERVLRERHQRALSDVFAAFAQANLYTAGRADPVLAYPDGERYAQLTETAIALPFHDPLLRMARLSARYFVATLGAERELVAELSATEQDLSGLRLLLAVERGGRIVALAGEGETLRVSARGQSADRVHVVVIDTRVAGAIQRAALCVGSAEEVAACRAEPADVGEASADAGAPSDAGVEVPVVDAGVPAEGGTSSSPRADGCGVGWRGERGRSPLSLGWLLVFAMGARRLRVNG